MPTLHLPKDAPRPQLNVVGEVILRKGSTVKQRFQLIAAVVPFLFLASGVARAQQGGPAAAEAPSTVHAHYVAPSATDVIKPGDKIGELFRRNMTQPYILQRLTPHTYFFESGNYAAAFY